MTKLSLRERFERRGRVRDIGLVKSGFPEIVTLRLSQGLRGIQSVDAIIALRRRGASTLNAKRAVEAAMEGQANVLDVPVVEDRRALAEELLSYGFEMAIVNPSVDAGDTRERLTLTQE